MKSIIRKICVICLAIFLTACATSRSEISLTPSVVASEGKPLAADAPTVFIRDVIDERVFEAAPREPSTPSLGFEGAEKATTAVKSRAIGRKRNGYGRALGDILLPEPQTVAALVRDNLSQALTEAGYKVVTSQSENNSTGMVLVVHIKTFWSWMNPGFALITMTSRISSDVEIVSQKGVTISAEAEIKKMVGGDSSWAEVMTEALNRYRKDAIQKLRR